MERKSDLRKLNTRQLEMHLKSAVDALTPNVLDRIDFSVPQTEGAGQETQTQAAILRLQRRMRGFAAAAAACICLVFMGGGTFHYHMENKRVESVIGIDVNPSIEISINRKERVLEARALNAEAQIIMEDMDLEGVDLNVAVNAVIGSMVTHGYLNDLDNAILVTVTNDSVKKARQLRSSVVEDIEQTLKANQLKAVVYDQQVIEDEEMEDLAQQYEISYGKAYFLKELIDQNPDLDLEDMEELSSLTMEEIAKKIAESSYELGELADQAKEQSEPESETAKAEEIPETEPVTEPETSEAVTEPESSSAAATEPETTAREPETTATAAPAASEEETEPEEDISDEPVEIDYVDYEDGLVYVYFAARVSWKKPSVVVRDEEGNSYAAVIAETSRTDCTFEVSGLEGGRSYMFVLGGLTPAGASEAVTVKGYFEKPDIAPEIEEETDEEEEGTKERETTAAEHTEPEESPKSPESAQPSETDEQPEPVRSWETAPLTETTRSPESQEEQLPLEGETGSEEGK